MATCKPGNGLKLGVALVALPILALALRNRDASSSYSRQVQLRESVQSTNGFVFLSGDSDDGLDDGATLAG